MKITFTPEMLEASEAAIQRALGIGLSVSNEVFRALAPLIAKQVMEECVALFGLLSVAVRSYDMKQTEQAARRIDELVSAILSQNIEVE